MNLFTNTFNYRLCRKPKINQQQQRIVSRNASANSGLLLASSVLLLLLLLVGWLPSSADGFKILGRDTALAGCYHNGTLYGDGSLVPTMEPCLSCQCANRTLLCSLRVCHEQPVPPPRGCVIVHHKSKCCPHMFCKRFNKRPMVSELDRKIVNFLDEFEQEQQIIQQRYDGFDGDENELRRRSEDPDSFDEFCVQNGTIYQSGSAMTTSSLCSYCYCINGKQKCVKPKCQLPQAPSHCSPVYMEGSCCPLKYDCSAGNGGATINISTVPKKQQNKWTPSKQKQSDAGLSMEEFSNLPHHRKRHSCHIHGRVFVEGEKLPMDQENPCNICYCIHGESRCTPKKCTPAMKNCVPIISPGQCCPSGYKCNMAKPRQFDLFSILFGVDENATDVSPTSQEMMTTMPPFIPLAPLDPESTSEKSFFDVLRDGLNFVEKNGEHFEAAMDKSANVSTKSPEKESPLEDSVAVVTVTESASDEYFDYENNDPDDDELFHPNEEVIAVSSSNTAAEKKKTSEEVKQTMKKVEMPSSTTTSTTTQKPSSTTVKTTTKTTTTTIRTTKRPTVTPTPDLEISTIKFIPSPTRVVNLATLRPVNSKAPSKENIQPGPVIHNQMGTNSSSTESLFSAFFSGLAEIFDEKFKQNATRNGTTMETGLTRSTTERPMNILPSQKPQFYITPSSIRPVPIIREEINHISLPFTTKKPSVVTSTSTTKRPPSTTRQSTTLRTTTKAPVTRTTQIPSVKTSKPTTTSRPVESSKSPPTSTTTTQKPTKAPETESTTIKPVTTIKTTISTTEKKKTTQVTYSTQTEKVSLLTAKPLAIPPTDNKSGVVVEDPDYHFDYNDPTLPPSLPNLKIIPFLPADAVKNDRQKPYDYYSLERTSYPSITTDVYDSHGQYELGEKTIDYSNSYVKEQLSHDIIKKGDGFKYPSITEPSDVITDKMEDKSDYDYLLEGYNLKKNGYGDDYMKNNFDVDVNSYMSFKSSGPVYKKGSVSNGQSNRVEPVGTAEIANIELRTEAPEFNFDLNRFSPPKETEGGFQPRNPERFYNKYDTTKYHVDITTEDAPGVDLSGYNAIKNQYFPDKTPLKTVSVDPNTISITTDRNIPEMKEIVDTLMPQIIRQSDDVVKENIPNFDGTKDPEHDDGLFGDLFSMLFKDETKPTPSPESNNFKTNLESSKEKFSGVAIPPFKTISSDFSTAELTTKRPQSEYEDPLHFDDVGVFDDNNSHDRENENGTAIKNILLDLLGHGNGAFGASTPTPPPPPPPQKQSLKFPVHSIPYIASNLHINPRPLEPIRNNLDSLLNEQPKTVAATAGQTYGQVLDDLNLATNSQSEYVVNPLNLETLKRHQSEKPAKIYSKPVTHKNDMGLLKLAGCNIYGRMYRVGRIISELSGPCLQCMCEEVGVHCTPLEC